MCEDDDADLIALVQNTAIQATTSTIESNPSCNKVPCQFCNILFTRFGVKRHENKCKPNNLNNNYQPAH